MFAWLAVGGWAFETREVEGAVFRGAASQTSMVSMELWKLREGGAVSPLGFKNMRNSRVTLDLRFFFQVKFLSASRCLLRSQTLIFHPGLFL